MSNQVYAFALNSTLQEIQNVCPEVTSSFIFKEEEILAKSKNTEDETITQTVDAFKNLKEKTDTIGGLEVLKIQGAKGRINIAAFNNFHLATVSSKEADEKLVNTLTRVLIPIVTKLVDEINSAFKIKELITNNDETPTIVPSEPVEDEITEEPVAELADDLSDEDKASEIEQFEEPQTSDFEEFDVEPLLPEPPVTQLMIENLGGLLVPSDTVRLGQDVITQWNELYSDKKIKEVDIEALNGKTTRCKFKKIKKSKDLGKGVIKMPEKIQLTLETSSGALVIVKPVVE
jgi:hypothetical protein